MPVGISRRFIAVVATAAAVFLGVSVATGTTIEASAFESGPATVTAAADDHGLPAGRRSDNGPAPMFLAVLASVVLVALAGSPAAPSATADVRADSTARHLPHRRGPPSPATATAA